MSLYPMNFQKRDNKIGYTFTISEPSISFNLERQPVILSGCILHFKRSSISPFQTEKEIAFRDNSPSHESVPLAEVEFLNLLPTLPGHLRCTLPQTVTSPLMAFITVCSNYFPPPNMLDLKTPTHPSVLRLATASFRKSSLKSLDWATIPHMLPPHSNTYFTINSCLSFLPLDCKLQRTNPCQPWPYLFPAPRREQAHSRHLVSICWLIFHLLPLKWEFLGDWDPALFIFVPQVHSVLPRNQFHWAMKVFLAIWPQPGRTRWSLHNDGTSSQFSDHVVSPWTWGGQFLNSIVISIPDSRQGKGPRSSSSFLNQQHPGLASAGFLRGPLHLVRE